MSVKPIPDGYHSVTPYLIIKDAAAALDFYKKAFGATEVMRLPGPGGQLMHAEIRIGDSTVMFTDEFPQMGAVGPKSLGGSPVSLYLYVVDVDAVTAQAVAAGATLKRPVQNQFYGDRVGMIEDPFGHTWAIATHKEDLTPEQIGERFAASMKPQGGG